ncbi:unnamed protein product, partial [Ectocarpus sp. 12 AP-2014]
AKFYHPSHAKSEITKMDMIGMAASKDSCAASAKPAQSLHEQQRTDTIRSDILIPVAMMRTATETCVSAFPSTALNERDLNTNAQSQKRHQALNLGVPHHQNKQDHHRQQ